MSRPRMEAIRLWDGQIVPGWTEAGVPCFGYGLAPSGVATRRQLRLQGLCPGGADPVARLVWRGGRRWAWLFRLDLAQSSRPASPAQLAAVDRALTARRACQACGAETGVYATSERLCPACEQAGLAVVEPLRAFPDDPFTYLNQTGRSAA